VSPADWESDPEWLEFVARVREDALRKIAGSKAVVSIAPRPGDEADIKFAVELGLSIMLSKPIIVVASPGQEIPPKLFAVADTVVQADVDLEEGRRALTEALRKLGLAEG
jgi:hypothetical protein